jgi:hypothetical protein
MAGFRAGPTGLNITVKDDKGTRSVGTGSGKSTGSNYSGSAAKPKAPRQTTKQKIKGAVKGAVKAVPTGVNLQKRKMHTVGDAVASMRPKPKKKT